MSITPVAPGSVAPGAEMEMRYLPDEPQQARPVAELESPVARYALWALGASALLPGLIIGVARLRRPY